MTAREELRAAIAAAAREKRRLVVAGAGSRGVEPQPGDASDSPPERFTTDALAAVELLDADEQLLVAEAGVPLVELERRLDEVGLVLPPTFPARLLSRLGCPGAAGGTLGGLFSDPRELPTATHSGRARDHVLGLTAVRGDGATLCAGGRVVKNVAGYDLTRLLCGARGRLGLVTSLSWRLVPRPEVVLLTVVRFASVDDTWQGLEALRSLPFEPLLCALDGSFRQLLVAVAGRRGVAYLHLGRVADAIGVHGSAGTPAEGEDAAAAGWAVTPAPSRNVQGCDTPAGLAVRVRLPFSAWPHFVEVTGAARAQVEWQSIFPTCHFGLGRVGGEASPPEAIRQLVNLRRLAAEHGGSVGLERRLDGWPREVDPWGARGGAADGGADAGAILARQVARAWDPAGVFWWEETP